MINSIFKSRVINKFNTKHDTPMFVYGHYSLVVYKNILNMKFSSVSDELFFKVGVSLGKSIYLNTSTSLASSKISRALGFFEKSGFGSSLVKKNNNNIISIENKSSPFANQFKKTFGVQDCVQDSFLAGIYSGIYSCALKKDVFFKEVNCVAQGHSSCIFESASEPIFSLENISQTIVDNYINFDTIISKNKKQSLEKLFESKKIKLIDNRLFIWNILSFLLPVSIYDVTNNILKESGYDFSDELLYLSTNHARVASIYLQEQFRVKKGKDTFNSCLEQLELCGSGVGTYTVEKNVLTISFENNYLLERHIDHHSNRNNSKEFRDVFAEGFIIGSFNYSFNESYSLIDTVINDKTITYSFKEIKGYTFDNHLKRKISKDAIRVIDEKMISSNIIVSYN